MRRDALALKALDALGSEVLIVWECEVTNLPALAQKLNSFLAAEHRFNTDAPADRRRKGPVAADTQMQGRTA